jgi:hypothetical protein
MMRQNHGSPLNPGSMLADPINAREAEILKLAESREDVSALRQHLKKILESKTFKGSHRSGQFLQYIVEQAIAGRFDSLKERVIGIELFGRPPSYDTGEDAIVRVTASDVRKRLLQFYGENGRLSRFYLGLPLGSYIPEITQLQGNEMVSAAESNRHPVSPPEKSSNAIEADSRPPANTAAEGEVQPTAETGSSATGVPRFWISIAAAVIILNLVGWALFWTYSAKTEAATASVVPWSTFAGSTHMTHLITSDPNIVSVQEITGSELSLSDYANRKYIPEPNKLTPEELRLVHIILWGDNSAAAIDPPIALRIEALAQANSIRVDAHAARSIQLSDLKTDDNFILIGSPRSNPWSALFTDQLDFRFVYDPTTRQEIIQNVHPQPSELPTYVPTAQGWATGRSFAIIAFLHNPDQNGHVLLLAGANGEGTQAAGKLATDLPRLSAALAGCGIKPAKVQQFELLLGLNTIAGSPNEVNIVACHILRPSQNR